MAEHPNAELIRKGYEAFASGDMEAVQTLLADDIVWHSPGNNPISGDMTGKEQVLGLFGKLMELTQGTFQQKIHDIVANDDHVVVLAEVSWEKPTSYRGRGAQTWHVKDGKAVEYWLFEQDQPAADASLNG